MATTFERATTQDYEGRQLPEPSQELGLVLVCSPDAVQCNLRHSLTRAKPLEIGRQPEHGWTIRDVHLSRLHCRIAWDPRQGRFRFGDAGSRNGSYLNGRRLDHSVLNAHDVLRFGDSIAVVDGEDPMPKLRDRAARVARSETSVLLLGHTGVGKEVLARFIHDASGRTGEFVAVNCAALPRELAAAELFGHVRGAFSNATSARQGLFISAQRGTLFLDEVGDLPLELQALLLRALQEKTIRPIGADREQSIDVRILAATNADLEAKIATGDFRPDLFARLAQVTLWIPPLAQRRSEILRLFQQLLECERVRVQLTADAAEALSIWGWPFNVREVQALVRSIAMLDRRLLDLGAIAELKPDLVDSLLRQRGEAKPLSNQPNPLADREGLRAVLKRHRGNVSRAAAELKTTRAQVYRWMRRLDIEKPG